jgi:hypothetical protein
MVAIKRGLQIIISWIKKEKRNLTFFLFGSLVLISVWTQKVHLNGQIIHTHTHTHTHTRTCTRTYTDTGMRMKGKEEGGGGVGCLRRAEEEGGF